MKTRIFNGFLTLSCLFLYLILGISLITEGHDVITTRITWNREISRTVLARCASCHHEGGAAFSLMTYAEARPWAVAIKEEVLSRRMPPWGAVKGFGDFRNDQALSAEQLELITQWVDGGVPEGNPQEQLTETKVPETPLAGSFESGIAVSGDFTLGGAFLLDGLWPERVSDNQSVQITAELPNGSIEPLLWLYEYKTEHAHPFLLRTPLNLPVGTVIRGVPADSKIILIPASPSPTAEGQIAP